MIKTYNPDFLSISVLDMLAMIALEQKQPYKIAYQLN